MPEPAPARTAGRAGPRSPAGRRIWNSPVRSSRPGIWYTSAGVEVQTVGEELFHVRRRAGLDFQPHRVPAAAGASRAPRSLRAGRPPRRRSRTRCRASRGTPQHDLSSMPGNRSLRCSRIASSSGRNACSGAGSAEWAVGRGAVVSSPLGLGLLLSFPTGFCPLLTRQREETAAARPAPAPRRTAGPRRSAGGA